MKRLSPGITFAFLCAVSVVLWLRPLLATFQLAWGDDEYTRILLILPVALGLAYQEFRRRKFDIRLWMPAVAFLAIPIVLELVSYRGRSDFRLWYEMAALVTCWIGCFALSFGWRATRALWFPLVFLLGLLPLPRVAVDIIIWDLQRGTIFFAEWFFRIVRVSVSHSGTVIYIPGLDIDVTPDCSSIRSSSILVVTTLVLAYVLLRSPWRRAFLVLMALPLSVAKNGLRIFVIAMLATRVDADYLTGRLHHQGGIVFLSIALGVEFLVIWWLRRGEVLSPQGTQGSTEEP